MISVTEPCSSLGILEHAVCRSFESSVSEYICTSGLDGNARKDKGFILVRAECPYIQFQASRVLALICSSGYKSVGACECA